MTSLLKGILSQGSLDMGKSPSFNDFSLCAGQDAVETELRLTSEDGGSDTPKAESRSGGALGGRQKDVWEGVFNPGRNFNMDRVGKNYFDHVENPKSSPTTWEYIVKAEHLKQLSYAHFGNSSDGFITAEEFRESLSRTGSPKWTDRSGGEKIDYTEFYDLMRKT